MNIVQAFIAGANFAKNVSILAQDAKAEKDEAEGHWVTIGAEAGADGEKHGGRPVFIKGDAPKGKKAETKKAESKKAESKKAETKAKKAESKKAETKKAETKKAESKKAETKKAESKKAESKKAESKKAEVSEESIKKAQQLSAYVDQKFRQIAQPGIISITETNQGLKRASENIPGASLSTYDDVKSSVSRIRKNISNIDKAMSSAKDQIKAAARDGKIEKDRVEAELTQYRKYCSKFKDYLDYADAQKYNLFRRANDGHREVIKNLSNLAELTSKLAKSVTDWSEKLPAQPRAESTPAQGVPKSFDLSTEEIKDVMHELRGLTDDRTGALEFGRKLFALADLNEEIDKTDRRYSLLLRRSGADAFTWAQQPLEEAHHHLGLAAKAARSVENYHWRGAIPSLRSEITRHLNKAKKLHQEAQNLIDDELTKLSEE